MIQTPFLAHFNAMEFILKNKNVKKNNVFTSLNRNGNETLN